MENRLIEKCQNGDRKALDQLYQLYAPLVKGICLRYTQSDNEAENLFQDSFIKILINLKDYHFQFSFDEWLKKIVLQISLENVKKDQLFNKPLITEVGEDSEEVDFDLEIAEIFSQEELIEIFQKIPCIYRAVFNLYTIEGFSHVDIADMLKITEISSRTKLMKARSYIRNIISEYDVLNISLKEFSNG